MNTNTTPALQATNIHQSFGHVDALRGVNLTLMPGEIVALLGVNGAGKSTFLDIVLGLATPTQGDISVYGMSPREAVRRSLVSAMLQTGSMPRDGKVRNTIDLVAAMHANPIPTDELLERTNLTKLAKRPLDKLSGGERQRIAIARAMLKDAPIVLLDEATASLDVENETVVQQALSRLLAGKTVIVIAHRMRTVENADKIVVLKDGVVAEQGSPAQLKAAGGEFARMVALQKEAADWQL